jgi:UDP-2-acetamido-3-amino-2,3-dideoxy-glucuronate N-acetyltransferase
VQELVALVRRGYLGRINYIYSNRLNLGKFRTEENILWSFAPHDISVIIRLMGDLPVEVISSGGAYLNREIADVTVTNLTFAGGTRGHIFVSWLHPYKEQKLVVVGSDKMAVFDDLSTEKLLVYPHKVNWVDHCPVPSRAEAEVIKVPSEEPLKRECAHFLDCIRSRKEPLTGAQSALAVLTVLDASQRSLNANGKKIILEKCQDEESAAAAEVFIHPSSIVEAGAVVGDGTRIWHFCHIMPGATIGRNCNLGQNVFVAANVSIGNNVKIQNNVSVYEGVTLEDDVFCGPSCVFTNVKTPRSAYPRNTASDYRKTLVKKGASIGANATILSGITIGEYVLVGAGALVSKDVPAHAVVTGNPARVRGWICKCGSVIVPASESELKCPACGTDERPGQGL